MKGVLRRVRNRIPEVLKSPFRTVGLVTTARFSPRHNLHGVRVVDLTNGTSGEQPIAALERAIATIRECDRRWFRRLRSEVSWIGIVYYGEPGYLPAVNACMLSREFLLREPIERIAGSLVHEVCHARLAVAGLSSAVFNAQRIEKVCTKATIDFLHAIPGGSEIARRYEQRLQMADQRPLFSRRVQFDRYVRVLRQSGVPEWILRIYSTLRSPRW